MTYLATPAGRRATMRALCPILLLMGLREAGGGSLPNGTVCPPGQYASGPAQTACQACPAGQSLSDAGACAPCRPGAFGQAAVCVACAAGTYATGQGMVGARSCRPCPAGRTTFTPGATVCFPCLEGTAGVGCAACPGGTYQTAMGATGCQACGAGRYSTAVGATSSLACVSCPVGMYMSGAGACLACPQFTTSPAASSAPAECRSQAGYFARRAGEAAQVCPADHFCPMGTTQPAPCPPGLRAPAGASICTMPPRDILLYEVIMLVLWWALLVLAVAYFAHQRLHESFPRVATVIRVAISTEKAPTAVELE